MKLSEVIRAAIEIGHRNGFVTFDQLDELVPPATTAPEDIEALMQALSDEGIDVREG
jgi:RNA polymerase primary sigma factor